MLFYKHLGAQLYDSKPKYSIFAMRT